VKKAWGDEIEREDLNRRNVRGKGDDGDGGLTERDTSGSLQRGGKHRYPAQRDFLGAQKKEVEKKKGWGE